MQNFSVTAEDLISPRGDHSEIKFSSLNFGNVPQVLGRGSFGTVYRCKYYGAEVAVKEVNMEDNVSSNKQYEFHHEVNMLKALKHPNIVQFLGAGRHGNKMYIVQELFLNGSLHDILQKKDKEISYSHRARICLEVAQGLLYMHKRDCLHRDLKSENVLMDSANRCKLADFGLSRLLIKDATPMSNVGSPWWRAPEVMTGLYGPPADIFSFGVLMLEVITRLPGEEIRIAMTYQKKIPGRVEFGVRPLMLKNTFSQELESAPPDLLHLALKCCEESPDDRPTTQDVVEILTKISEGINNYEVEIKTKFRDKLKMWTTCAGTGFQFWIDLTISKFRFDYWNISVPLESIVVRLETRIKEKTEVQIDELQKSFIGSILNESDPNSEVQIDKFVPFWIWFYHTEVALLHDRIFPLWKAGFIYGFVDKITANIWLKQLNQDGVFIIRFSTSQPGNLAINCFFGGRVTTPILIEFDSGKSIFFLGDKRCSTIKEVFSKNNLDRLNTVFPDQDIHHPKFLQAHREVEKSIEQEINPYSDTLIDPPADIKAAKKFNLNDDLSWTGEEQRRTTETPSVGSGDRNGVFTVKERKIYKNTLENL